MPVDVLVVAHNLALFSFQKAHTIFSVKSWTHFKMKGYTNGCTFNFIISVITRNPFCNVLIMQNFRIVWILK